MGSKLVNGTAYTRMRILGDVATIPVRIPRRKAAARKQNKDVLRTGFTVEPIGDDEYFGFELDGDGRFLLGDFTVTHNTSFVMNIIANLTRPAGNDNAPPPEGAAFFSLEMPRQQVAIRFACAEENVSVTAARKNSMNDDSWSRLQRGADALQRFPIWIDDAPSVSLLDVRARVRKLQRDIEAGRSVVPCRRLKLVVIDYLQLMNGLRERHENRENEVSRLSRGLKALAKDLNVAVIAVSQLNRAPERRGKKEERKPELSDLRESGAIEQDADNVFFVYRPSYYDEDARPDAAECIVAKQRNGPTGSVALTFLSESVRFYSREEESYDELSGDFEEP